jgi:hypothetical protein
MREFLEICLSWPALPATVLLLLVSAYWAFVALGALDLDFADVDLDADLQTDGEVLSFGFVVLRWLNIGEVPLMVWTTVFTLSLWTATMLIDGRSTHDATGEIALALLRNAGIAIVATKLFTQPLRGKFDPSEPLKADDLIGRTCLIKTSEVTPLHGQAEYKTDGSPLFLHVRTAQGTLRKGEPAEIVGYDTARHVHIVQSAKREE